MSTGNDRIWRSILERLRAAGSDPHVKIGILGSAASETHSPESGLTVADIAAIHEFGAPSAGIPERSFIRSTINDREQDIEMVLASEARKILTGESTVQTSLGRLGLWTEAQMKNQITIGDKISPPLKPETIARKGSSRPLIDTSRMLNAITHEVKK